MAAHSAIMFQANMESGLNNNCCVTDGTAVLLAKQSALRWVQDALEWDSWQITPASSWSRECRSDAYQAIYDLPTRATVQQFARLSWALSVFKGSKRQRLYAYARGIC